MAIFGPKTRFLTQKARMKISPYLSCRFRIDVRITVLVRCVIGIFIFAGIVIHFHFGLVALMICTRWQDCFARSRLNQIPIRIRLIGEIFQRRLQFLFDRDRFESECFVANFDNIPVLNIPVKQDLISLKIIVQLPLDS